MEKKLSWRHHYVPKFYLKGFTNSTGLFYLFNKHKGKVESVPKAPESYFFERDRNTFHVPNGELDDFIESSFHKKFDNQSKYAFEKLRKSGVNAIKNDARALSSILQFLNGIFYRIPKYDDFHNQEILNGNDKYFLPIYKGNDIDVSHEYYQLHKHEELYRYACRFFLSLHGIVPVGDELKKWTVVELPATEVNQIFLTCDCPMIIDDERHYNSGKEIILSPLTEKHIVVRTNLPLAQTINITELIYFVNLYLITIAEKYVCSSREDILNFYIDRRDSFDPEMIKGKLVSMVSSF